MHVHFVGIGGSGVSGLALMAQRMGYEVSGCDENVSPYFKMVESKGIKCYSGHSSDHMQGVDLVVRSSAVPMDSEEIRYALKKGIVVISRGTFLSKMMEGKDVIGVAGSHGKTSTTWMIYHILKKAGLNPSVYAGGKSGGVSNISEGSPYIIELDESDGSMFETTPGILLINNLEFEHADFYSNPEEMLNSFERYLLSWEPDTLIIGRGYDLSDALFSMFTPSSFLTVAELNESGSFQNVSGLDFFVKEEAVYLLSDDTEIYVGSVREPAHILQNRSAALLASLSFLKKINVTIPKIDFKKLWTEIPVVDRRFQVVGKYKGVDLIDDYAHHPSEIRALVEQAELKYGNFCLIFQPHRVSRFTVFYDKFLEVLKYVEPLIVLPVYNAGETVKGADTESFYRELKQNGSVVYYFKSVDDAGVFIKKNIEGLHVSAVIAAGAGDLNKVFELVGVK